MISNDTATSPHVMATANRLRLVQADFADASPEQRKQYLSDEISRALAGIVPESRADFLRALGTAFPSWDPAEQQLSSGVLASVSTISSGDSNSTVDQRELNDPSFLANRLCELAPTLDESTKEALLATLRQGGAIPGAPASPWSAEELLALRSKLQITDLKKLDLHRLLELLTAMTDFSTSLHQLVGVAWRELAPAADFKHRAGSLQNAMGRFVTGDASVNKQQVSAEFEKLRQLVASLIASVGEVGRTFAQSYNGRFAPSNVQSVAANEPGKMFQNIEVKSWRKYVEIWDTLDESSIEREIREMIGKSAESIMRGIAKN